MNMMRRIIASALIFIFMTSGVLPVNALAASAADFTSSTSSIITSTTAPVGKIVGEITDKRTKNEKVYFKDDKTYEVDLYNSVVHYKDANGNWQDIDNSLIDSTDVNGNSVLKNKANDFNVVISKNANTNKLVTITKEDYELSWNLEKTAQTAVPSSSLQTFPGTGMVDQAATTNTITTDTSVNNVSASVKQVDPLAAQSSIDNAASVEAENIKGFGKLSDDKKAELKQTVEYNENIKTLKNISSSVDFNNILQDTNLNYALNGDTLKESITLNNVPVVPIYKFDLSIKNLVPKIDSKNNIVFYDKADESKAIYTMQAPYMFDAKKQISNNISMSIDKNNNSDGYVLTVKPDPNWLNDVQRAYPVVIDPTIITSMDINSIKDSFVGSNVPDTNYYNAMYLETGYGAYSHINRSYIKFDNLPQLTSSDMITSASLHLVCNYSNVSQVNVHEVLGDWDSKSITWSNMPLYNSVIEDYQMVSTSGIRYTWDITNIVKKWYTTNNNYGLMLKANDESGGYTEFVSSDISEQYSYARPKATIDYINNTGLESYWTYHSANAGRAGTGFTNDYDGNLTFVHSDLSMSGSRMPISITHFYNSSEAVANDWSRGRQFMGAGWTMNVMQRLYKQTVGGKYYQIYIDSDGTKHYFEDNSSWTADQISDELKLGYTLIKDSGYTYIKDKSGSQVKFYWDGSLCSFIDSNGNSTQTEWSVAPGTGVKILTKLTDGAGRETHLSYDSNGVLMSITDPDLRVTYYYYDTQSFQKLSQITYPDSYVTKFNYDSNYRLTSVSNYAPNGTNYGPTISYQYYGYSPYRVMQVSESNGGTQGGQLNFSYGNNETTMTDNNGRKNIYEFNNIGKTVCIQDNDGNASYYDYSDSSNSTKMSLESKLQKTEVNYIQNHNMETSSNWSPLTWSGATGFQSFTTEDKYMGSKSMKITSTSTNGGLDYEQYGVQLARGNAYTLSGYVKTEGVTSGSGVGAAIFVCYKDVHGVDQYLKKYINGSGDWHREEIQFTLPSDAQLSTVSVGCEIIGAVGTAYFDCLQLESGIIANRYNLVENADFTYGTSSWTKNSQCDSNDYVATASSGHPSSFDNNAFQFNGSATKTKNIEQVINVSGKKGDSFVVGGWAKGNSAPLNDSRSFRLTLGFKLPSGSYEWHDANFNNDSNAWQYISSPIVTNSDYTEIDYYVIYYNNVNTAQFDGLQLYKEEFGTSYAYDSNGNVLSTADLSKQSSTFEYNTTNDLIKATSPKGGQFNYKYDTKHNIEEAKTATNVTYSFKYDSNNGNPISSTIGDTSLGITSTAEYTSDGNYLSSMTDSSDHIVGYSWGSSTGYLNSVTDANENTTSYTYDYGNNKDDNLTKVAASDGTNTVSEEYYYSNDKLSSILHNGFNYNFAYDGLGNNTKVSIGAWEDPNSIHLISNSYNTTTGNLENSTYGNEQSVNYFYDSLDRLKEKVCGTRKFTYQYDGNGNLGFKQDIVSNVCVASFRYIYDLANRLVQTIDLVGNTTTYGYESVSNPIDTIKLWHYHGDGRTYHDVIVQLSNDPTFKSGVKTVYNNDKNNSSGLGNGANDEYAESGSGMTISTGSQNYRYVRCYSNGSTANAYNHYVEVEVDGSSGNMSAGKSITSSVAFTNPTRVTDGDIATSNYADGTTGSQWIQIDLGASSSIGNNLTSISETIKDQDKPITTNYAYDLDNRETQVTLNNGSYLINTYEDNKIGRLSQKSIHMGNNTYTTTFDYLQGSGGETTTTTKVGSITNDGNAILYEYDVNGNITKITQGDQDITYHYNKLNELIREDNEVLNKTITYSYDVGGNITTKTEYGYTTGTNLGAATATHSYTCGKDTIWKDLLKEYDGTGLSYDGIGNLTHIGNTWSFTWEAGRQLQTADKTGLSISYKYDDSGIRTQKTVNNGTTNVTTFYHLVGDKVTYEEVGTDTKIYYTYDSSGNLVSMNLNGTEYYYIKNAQGDIIGLFDSTGTQVVSYTYDSWGKIISIDGSKKDDVGVKNPYRYRSYRYDSETQLYYLQSRYYNPEWGRFINADGIIGRTGGLLEHNLFAYCLNNVVNGRDSHGLLFEFDSGEDYNSYLQWYAPQKQQESNIFIESLPSNEQFSSVGINSMISTAEFGVGTVMSETPNSVTVPMNREALRGGLSFTIPIEGAALKRNFGVLETKAGAVGIGITVFNIWDNYQKYSEEEALGRSSIDYWATASVIIVGLCCPEAMVVISVSLLVGIGAETAKNYLWKKET